MKEDVSPTVTLHEYLTTMNQLRREYVDSRFAAGEKSVLGLEKWIHDAERRINERIDEKEKTSDNRYVLLEERMQRMAAFRDQITGERGLYVTRDQLETTKVSIANEIDILKRSMQISSGREVGTSKVWQAIVAALAGMAAIGTSITALHAFIK